MKVSAILMLCIQFTVSSLAADINTAEIMKGAPVRFINYSGPTPAGYSRQAVRGIGRSLASGSSSEMYSSGMKYRIIHAVDPDDRKRLSADIVIIERKARVNHINSILEIIAGYYEAAYGLTVREADALALYTAYYNAVYRSNMDYFGAVYNSRVMKNIQKENAGIALRYDQWPGKTRILIPLFDPENPAPDAFTVTDNTVKKKVDESTPVKKDSAVLIKLKERQIVKEEKTLELRDKQLSERERSTAEKEKNLIAKKNETAVKRDNIDEEKRVVEKEVDPVRKKEKTDEVLKKESDVAREEEAQRREEKTVEDEKKKNADERSEINKKKESIEARKIETAKEKMEVEKENSSDTETEKRASAVVKKEEELKEREKVIEKKEEELSAKNDKIFKDRFYYLKINNYANEGVYNNELCIVNPDSMKILLKSPYQTIAGRKFDIFPKGVVVIGYEGGGNFNHVLVMLDHQKLQKVTAGTDIIFWRSFIEIRDGKIYAVVSENGSFFLARYDDDLKREIKSKVEVDKDSAVSFYKDRIYINAPDKKITVFDRSTFEKIGEIDPSRDIEK